MLPSLTALSKTFQTGAINFSRITPNIEKTKAKLQQVLDVQKPLKVLKSDMKNRLQRFSLTERYTKAMLWNIDDGFPHNVLSILDVFSIFNLDNIPTNTTSSEFRVYDHNEINVLPNHFFANEAENKDTFIEEWESFKFDL